MKFFNKKNYNDYRITCYVDETKRVRKLADEYAADGTVVDVRAHGYLLKENLRVTVSFKSEKNMVAIRKAFMNEFENYDLDVYKQSITIYREIGLD